MWLLRARSGTPEISLLNGAHRRIQQRLGSDMPRRVGTGTRTVTNGDDLAARFAVGIEAAHLDGGAADVDGEDPSRSHDCTGPFGSTTALMQSGERTAARACAYSSIVYRWVIMPREETRPARSA